MFTMFTNLVPMAAEMDFSVLTSGMTVITGALSSACDSVPSNPLTLAFVASSIAGIGFGFIKKAKRAAR